MRLYLATKNKHKVEEIRSILDTFEILTFDTLPDIEESGITFEENANIKSIFLSKLVDEYVIADDSGLICDTLIDKPGIYSARYAGKNSSDMDNILKLLSDMSKTSERDARFICNISLAKNGEVIKNFIGTLHGKIAYELKGDNGFGYDPIFIIDNDRTLAELSPIEKNMISHRNIALNKLKKYLLG